MGGRMNQAATEFAGLIQIVATELLGDPNPKLSTRKELRYGNRGSLSVDLEKDCWHDHEAGDGGGVLDLIRRETGKDARGAAEWMRERGLIDAAPQQRREVARYTYRDEGGAPLFDVVRFSPKDFRQQAASGAWSLKGVRRVLYRLPEIMAARGEPVLIVEGEKDADRLLAMGFIATCNPGGAGKWSADYTKALAGRRCIVIPDNDGPGREHAQGEVFTSAVLEMTAAPIKRRPKMSPANRLGMDTFLRAKRDAGLGDNLGAEIHLEDWRLVFYAGHTGDTTEAKKKAFQRVRDALVKDGDLAVTDDLYRLVRLPEAKG